MIAGETAHLAGSMTERADVMRKVLRLLGQMWFGTAVTLAIVIGTALYVELYGPVYDVWGWPELVLGGLILCASLMAGAEALFRAPNPYARTNPLYGLQDVSPNRDLDSGGIGWFIQAIPLTATAIVLAAFFWIA